MNSDNLILLLGQRIKKKQTAQPCSRGLCLLPGSKKQKNKA